MLIQPLRAKRDRLFGALLADDVPRIVLEKCCQNPSVYPTGYYDDELDDMTCPFGWQSFHAACIAVRDAERSEITAALAR